MFIGRSAHEERMISMLYWFPLLRKIGMRVPDTIFVNYPYSEREMWRLFDGEKPEGWEQFIDRIKTAAEEFGYPVFLRTESTSDKHSWKDTCYLASAEDVKSHVYRLAELSAMAEIPMGFWAVRRLIPTTPLVTAFPGDMPIAAERRVFAKQGEILCHHPYWPADAFKDEDVPDDQLAELQAISDADREEVETMAKYVSKYIPDAYSIDFLKDAEGKWWCIDMATLASSYHWAGCPNDPGAEQL